jgi:hypothetical protein
MADIGDGTYTAVVDRFEDEVAVVLIEADGETIAERVVDRETLPEDGRQVDAILEVTVSEGQLTSITYDAAASEARKRDAQQRFDRLAERPPSDEGSN